MPAPTDPTAFPTAAPVPYPHPPPIYELLLLLAPLAAPFLPAHVTATDYPAAIQTLLQNVLVPVDSRLRELLPRTGNWSHEFFTALLLSGRWTLATDVKLAFVLDPFDVVESPVDAAARVLWSVGMWRRNGYRGSRREELGWQADALLGAFTVPGKEIDAVRTAEGEGVHAVVWVGGRAWVVRLFGAGENPGVLGVEDIRAQLDAIVEAAENLEPPALSVAALSHRLPRPLWARAKSALEKNPANMAPLRLLYSSLVTLALEPYPLPAATDAALNNVRGHADSLNRFADQTFGVVVYADGRVGVTADHTVADCAAGLETALWLGKLARPASAGEEAGVAGVAKELAFDFGVVGETVVLGIEAPGRYKDSVTRSVSTLRLPLPGALDRAHSTDFVLQLALQAAVGEAAPITQSVFQRGVVAPRSELVMAVTEEGKAFVAMLRRKEGSKEERVAAFVAARKARAERIKTRTFPFYRNFFLAPALDALLVETAAEDAALATLQTVLKVAGGAPASEDGLGNTVQFTGFTVAKGDGVEAALSNIYMEQQLVVFYLAKIDATDPNGNGEVEVGFSATGHWRVDVEGVVARFQRAFVDIVDVAVDAAAAGDLVEEL